MSPRPWFFILALLAAPLQAKDDAPAPTLLEPVVKSQASEDQERVIFQTTAAVWRTNKRRVVPEPVAVADVPPQPLVVVSAITIMDAMTGLVTIPWDLVASPFRKPTTFLKTTWNISGRLADNAGHPRAFVPLTITVDRFDAGRNASGGQAASTDTHSDSNGAFAVSLTGHAHKSERALISIYSERSDGVRQLESRVFY